MNNKIRSIIAKLLKNEISTESFINKYEKEQKIEINEVYVKDLIKKAITNKSAIDLEEALILIFSCDFDKYDFIKELCSVILEPWHTKHGDIVSLLQKLDDASIVDYLYKVATIHFDYLDYDDTYQLSRKCIKALAAIGNSDAKDKLEILLKNMNPIISEYAKKELDKFN